jgi:hypothetical protein
VGSGVSQSRAGTVITITTDERKRSREEVNMELGQIYIVGAKRSPDDGAVILIVGDADIALDADEARQLAQELLRAAD